MIAFFPQLYPDELLYSAFARYFDKSGYGIYRAAAEDIFENGLVKPDILFVSRLRNGLVDILKKQKSWEQIITEHTMYPYYGRFLTQERRKRAFQSLVNMDGLHRRALQMPNAGDADRQLLRYCPLCCQHDRKKYGEMYWHRQHQMYGVTVCPVHGCQLNSSAVSLSGKASPGFFSAEINVEECQPQSCNNLIEKKLATYIGELFCQDIVDAETPVFRYLHEKMAGGKYTSPRGEQKNVSLLHNDLLDYYSDLQDNPLTELWQLKKVTDGKTALTKNIAMVAMFIGIPPNELAAMQMPKELHREAFDRKVRELHGQGLKYPQIAKIMGAPLDVVKPIGENRYGKYVKGRGENKGGIKRHDWNKVDQELLPQVKEAIEIIYNKGGRPGRVTFGSVARHLGFSEKRYPNLKLCREEVEKNREDWEHFWAREIIYFYEQLRREGKPITVTAIMNLTNSKRRNLIKAIPYINQYTDPETAVVISGLITE